MAPQPAAAFTAEFTYQATASDGSNGGLADGFAFVLQNDPRGGLALGDEGGAIGYDSSRSHPIQTSRAVVFDLFGSPGEAVGTDGEHGVYGDTAPVDLGSGHPIRITLDGDGATVLDMLRD